MTFDWTTFFLEILNFFILLWILRKFLYRPILEVIAARQRRIAEQLAEAERTRTEALAAKAECESRLAAFEREKTQARAALEREIAAERERLLALLSDELAEVRAKQEAREARERQEWLRTTEQRVLELGGRFTAKLLERLATPELETRLVELTLADLDALPAAEIEQFRAALADDGLEIVSAFPLPADRRTALTQAVGRLAGRSVDPGFREDPALLAGLRIHAGAWVLGANLRDELKFFRDVPYQGNP
jgi:F-type H+-transporting ATPase subunit b